MSEQNQTRLTPLQEAVNVAQSHYLAFVTDYAKFADKGTASAVARARKSLAELARQAKVVRKQLQLSKVAVVAAKKAAKA